MNELQLNTAIETDGLIYDYEPPTYGTKYDWSELLKQFKVEDIVGISGVPKRMVYNIRSGKTKPENKTAEKLLQQWGKYMFNIMKWFSIILLGIIVFGLLTQVSPPFAFIALIAGIIAIIIYVSRDKNVQPVNARWQHYIDAGFLYVPNGPIPIGAMVMINAPGWEYDSHWGTVTDIKGERYVINECGKYYPFELLIVDQAVAIIVNYLASYYETTPCDMLEQVYQVGLQEAQEHINWTQRPEIRLVKAQEDQARAFEDLATATDRGAQALEDIAFYERMRWIRGL